MKVTWMSGCLRGAWILTAVLFLSGVAWGNELLVNRGFEIEGASEEAESWWYAQEAGRVVWAARSGIAGNAFFPAGNTYGAFGQDVAVDMQDGCVFNFSIYGKAEPNYLNSNTAFQISFYSGEELRYSVLQNVYDELASSRDAWVQISLVHTSMLTDIDKVVVMCLFADGTIPGGQTQATCQWDDASLLQSGQVEKQHVLGKFEPVEGLYLGVLLNQGGTASDLQSFNDKAGKTHAVYAKFVVLQTDPYPTEWVEMVRSEYPSAAVHLTLEPMIGFSNFYTESAWVPGNETYDAAYDFVTNCAAAGCPVFLRFAHEANGDWYPWHPEYSTRYGVEDTVTPETYIQGWRNFADMVHTLAPNVAMVWAPNQGNGPDPLPHYGRVYPGDEYVDWVGLSVYNGSTYGSSNEVMNYQFRNAVERGYWQENEDSSDDTFEDFYWEFSDPDNPAGHGKPMMIAETAALFVPEYLMTNEVVISDFESMDGPVFTPSRTMAEFVNLKDDGLASTNYNPLESFDSKSEWWDSWDDLVVSVSTNRVQGSGAFNLSGTPGIGTKTVGGIGTDSLSVTDWSSYDGFELWVKCDNDGRDVPPELSVRVRTKNPTVDTYYADQYIPWISGKEYTPVKVRFSDMDLSPNGTDWSQVEALILTMNSTATNSRPDDLLIDRWSLVDFTNSLYADQLWGTPWVDGADPSGSFTFVRTNDAFSGYHDSSLYMTGVDSNSDAYIGGNNFFTRPEDRDWSGANAMNLLVRCAETNSAEALVQFSLTDGMNHTAVVGRVVATTNYMNMTIPFSQFDAHESFEWTNVTEVTFELLTGTKGSAPSPVYIKRWQLGTATYMQEQDWWQAGEGYQPYGDSTWTQSADSVVGDYSLQISGVVTSDTQWYIGGNGFAVPVVQQDWSGSDAIAIHGKQGELSNRVLPKFKITCDNDYAETNGNEAWIEVKVSNTDWQDIVLPYTAFDVDAGFSWTNVKMVKIENFTGDAGEQPNDLYLDHFRRVSAAVTNNADNVAWKNDWYRQLYSLRDNDAADPAYAGIRQSFRNIHMINWFHINKYEDGIFKNLSLAEDGSGDVAYEGYYNMVSDPYFLSGMVVDADGDQIADTWVEQHFPGAGGSFDPYADDDGDQMNNWQEYLAGTSPTNEASLLDASAGAVELALDDQYVIEWPSEEGKVYAVLTSTNMLSDFRFAQSAIEATPPMNSCTVTVENASSLFFKVKVVP